MLEIDSRWEKFPQPRLHGSITSDGMESNGCPLDINNLAKRMTHELQGIKIVLRLRSPTQCQTSPVGFMCVGHANVEANNDRDVLTSQTSQIRNFTCKPHPFLLYFCIWDSTKGENRGSWLKTHPRNLERKSEVLTTKSSNKQPGTLHVPNIARLRLKVIPAQCVPWTWDGSPSSFMVISSGTQALLPKKK